MPSTSKPLPVCQQCRMAMALDRIVPCAAEYDLWSYICSECGGVFSMVEARTADCTLVDERRVVLRHAVTTPATIAAGRRQIACTVRNLSATGASLNLNSRARLPKNFIFTTAGSPLSCRAVWRRGKQVGIAFD